MAKKKLVTDELSKEFQPLEERWNAIRSTYDDPDPPIGIGEEGWREFSEIGLIIKPHPDHRSFAQAWADTLTQLPQRLT